MKHLVTFMRNQEKYEVFTYRTNIHAMLEELFEDDEIDMDLDFIECLRSCKTNRDQNDILNKNTRTSSYSSIWIRMIRGTMRAS